MIEVFLGGLSGILLKEYFDRRRERPSSPALEGNSESNPALEGGESPLQQVRVYFRHRIHATEERYEPVFVCGKEVLYVSIMSNSSLRDGMDSHLDAADKTKTRLKVLTWSPEEDAMIEAFRRHLGENESNPKATVDQVREAEAWWRNAKSRHPSLDLRTYDSCPTMQGIVVKDDWALIELLPYNTPPKDRPALFLTKTDDPKLFDLFSEKFDLLWEDSRP